MLRPDVDLVDYDQSKCTLRPAMMEQDVDECVVVGHKLR